MDVPESANTKQERKENTQSGRSQEPVLGSTGLNNRSCFLVPSAPLSTLSIFTFKRKVSVSDKRRQSQIGFQITQSLTFSLSLLNFF